MRKIDGKFCKKALHFLIKTDIIGMIEKKGTAAEGGVMEILKNIANVFLQFQGYYVLEWLLFAVLMYFVFKTLKENNATNLIVVYCLLVVCVGAVMLFSENLDASIYLIFLMLASLFFLLLFSTEVKRQIWSGKHTTQAATVESSASVGSRAEEYVASIVKAVQSLSKANIGALIVLSNGNLPKDIIDSGVSLGAKISTQLIEGIFIPKAPLHDGAMIIFGDKIQAAGCFLPLTQRDFPKDFGTRHRAGIGVTEVADVTTIIVSEETGIVSVVKRGEITRYADSELLKKFLREYYWKEFKTTTGGRKA